MHRVQRQLHSQKCHGLDASLSSSCIKSVGFIKLHQACWLHQVASSLLASSSCIKPVGFIKLHQACWFHQVASSLLASSSCVKPVKMKIRLIFANLWQVVGNNLHQASGSSKKSWQSTCIKPFHNLQKTCYHQAGANDASPSWFIDLTTAK